MKLKFYRITVNGPQPHSTVIAARDLTEARAVGLRQLGVNDPPPGGVNTSGHRIDVGECTADEWLAAESRRRGIPASEIELPENDTPTPPPPAQPPEAIAQPPEAIEPPANDEQGRDLAEAEQSEPPKE